MTGLDALPLRADLRGLTPYGAPQLDVPVRLNTNENPYPPSQRVVGALRDAVTREGAGLNRYPDREALDLRTELAAYVGHRADGVWAANGSNEVLQQLCQAFGGAGRTALGFEPSYSMHPLIATGTGMRWVAAQRAADFSLSAADAVRAVQRELPDIVFLCSPNNPTATALSHELIAAVADAAPGMVVVDEALRRVLARAVRGVAARRSAAAGGHPDDEQGLRLRRRPRRLPGGRSGGRRRDPAGAAALPSFRTDPGGRQGRARAHRRTAICRCGHQRRA
jgi:histidinol-phosphate aminotransferase